MWQVRVACSSCPEETDLSVEELDDVEREVCSCGYSYVVISVGSFEPVHASDARVIEFPRRRSLSEAA
jgi:formate dehydrogenase maturation protein FdhE